MSSYMYNSVYILFVDEYEKKRKRLISQVVREKC